MKTWIIWATLAIAALAALGFFLSWSIDYNKYTGKADLKVNIAYFYVSTVVFGVPLLGVTRYFQSRQRDMRLRSEYWWFYQAVGLTIIGLVALVSALHSAEQQDGDLTLISCIVGFLVLLLAGISLIGYVAAYDDYLQRQPQQRERENLTTE